MSRPIVASIDEPEHSRNITRVGKACEPCRIRKTRCDISTRTICSECTKRGQTDGCRIREKARPNRPTTRKAKDTAQSLSPFPDPLINRISTSNIYLPSAVPNDAPLSFAPQPSRPVPIYQRSVLVEGVGYISPSSAVESILRAQALDRYGIQLDLSMPSENIFNARQSRYLNLEEIGLKIGSPTSLSQAQHWINTHFSAIHHNTPFLHLPQVLDIARKVFASEGGVYGANDELALLYAVLALGSLREQTYDSQTGQYRSLVTSLSIDDLLLGFGCSPQSDQASFRSGSTAQSLFRLAQEELEQLEEPSEAAVQALFLLHMFVSNTSMGRRSRDYVARAVMMSHEVGLNRPLNTMPTRDDHAIRRRSILYLYVYFSDVYLSALDSHAPLIKQHDFDPAVFAPINQALPSAVDGTGTPVTGVRSFVDLVTTIGSVLERLHSGYHAGAQPSIELVLELDTEMDDLRRRLGAPTFTSDVPQGVLPSSHRTITAGSLLRQIHYNWSRIALRAPFLRHALLKHSALSICARSALSILQCHQRVLNAGILNLPWMQLRRVATSVYLVFIALWAGEITHWDAETAVKNTLEALCIICTRWKTATSVARTVVQLADKSGLNFDMPAAVVAGHQTASTLPDQQTQIQSGTRDQTLSLAVDPQPQPSSFDINVPAVNFHGMENGSGDMPDFGIDLSTFGIEQFSNWEISHQPPW